MHVYIYIYKFYHIKENIISNTMDKTFATALTKAPIPNWATANDAHIDEMYQTTELETWFAGINDLRDGNNGSVISGDYVNKLEIFLQLIHKFIETGTGSLMDSSCDIMQIVTLYSFQNTVTVSEPLIRPCAEDMGFFELMIWQLLQSCKRMGKSLSVEFTSDKMKKDLARISPHFLEMTRPIRGQGVGALHKCMYIHYQDILLNLNSNHFGIAHILRGSEDGNPWELRLNKHSLPSAADLMSQNWVNSRLMRSSQRDDDDEVENLMSSLSVQSRKRGKDDMDCESGSRRRQNL